MAFSRPTLSEIINRILADVSARLGSTASILRRAWVRVFSTVMGGMIHLLYGYISWAVDQIFVKTADEDSLIKKGSAYGIFRYAATYAAGVIPVSGTQGVIVQAGTIFQRGDGVRYMITEDTGIGLTATDMPARAVVAGTNGNANPGVALTLESPLIGVISETVVGTSGMTGGIDLEPIEDYRRRLEQRIQQPPQGGAKIDYETWAKSVPGVGTLMVYGPDDISKSLDPENPGPLPVTPPVGQVWIYFAEASTGDTPTPARIAQVQAVIDANKPVTAKAIVFGISKVNPTFVINAKVQSGYTFDQMKNDIIGNLQDLLISEGLPGNTIHLSQIQEAISKAASEAYHELISPTTAIELDYNQIARIDPALVEINQYI